MMDVFELAATPNEWRRRFWREEIPEASALQFRQDVFDPVSFAQIWPQASRGAQAALVGPEFAPFFLDITHYVPKMLAEIRMVDALFFENGRWWPESLFREMLHQMIAKTAADLDTQAIAYITGSSPLTRAAFSVVVQLGFENIRIVADDYDAALELSEDMRQQNFGLSTQVMRNTDLTLQPNNGSLLINTIPLEGKKELIEDLSYLNFIYSNGLVVDTNVLPLHHQLLEESTNVGLRVLSGATLQGACDWRWLQKVLAGKVMPLQDYLKKWIDWLEKTRQRSSNQAEGTGLHFYTWRVSN